MTDNQLPTPKWHEREVGIGELKPYERNPRTSTVREFEQLIESLKKFGQFAPLLVNEDLAVAGGHQRLKAMAMLGWLTVRVTVPDRMLSEAEFKEALIRHNVLNGSWTGGVTELEFTAPQLKMMGVPLKFQPSKAQQPAPDAKKDVRTYTIIFDTEAQQQAWNDFMLHLIDRFPNSHASNAERIVAFLREVRKDDRIPA